MPSFNPRTLSREWGTGAAQAGIEGRGRRAGRGEGQGRAGRKVRTRGKFATGTLENPLPFPWLPTVTVLHPMFSDPRAQKVSEVVVEPLSPVDHTNIQGLMEGGGTSSLHHEEGVFLPLTLGFGSVQFRSVVGCRVGGSFGAHFALFEVILVGHALVVCWLCG
eukprot:Gb_13026 [translate_table: standard]